MINFKEKNKLPLTFKFIEEHKAHNTKTKKKEIVYYNVSEKYQTDFYLRERCYKDIVRML